MGTAPDLQSQRADVHYKVPKETLKRLPTCFPTDAHVFRLDPSYESDRGEEAENLTHIPVNDDHVRIYRELQNCNRYALVVPSKHEHMWHSAVYFCGVHLTATGAHYGRLAAKKKI